MQFDMQAVKENFGKAAAHYDANALLQNHVRCLLAQMAEGYFAPRARILDAGCGTGAFAYENAKPHWRVMQMDIAVSMCAQAAKNALTINAGVEHLPFAEASFDAVFSSLMLQWINDPSAAWFEMARVLTPGGYISVSTLTAGTLTELKESFAAIDSSAHVSDFYQPHEIMAQARAAGLSLVSARQTPVVEYYAHTIALMRALQAIGATHKQQNRRKSLMTPAQFAQVEAAYEKRYRQKRGLPVTWQTFYLLLRKD